MVCDIRTLCRTKTNTFKMWLSKFPIEDRVNIRDILEYYDPLSLYGLSCDYVSEYRPYVSKIIRRAEFNMTHDEIWDICMNLFELDDYHQYTCFYNMVEEICNVFHNETISRNRIVARTLQYNLKDELKRMWVEKIYHPDKIQELMDIGMDDDEAFIHIGNTLGFD